MPSPNKRQQVYKQHSHNEAKMWQYDETMCAAHIQYIETTVAEHLPYGWSWYVRDIQ